MNYVANEHDIQFSISVKRSLTICTGTKENQFKLLSISSHVSVNDKR